MKRILLEVRENVTFNLQNERLGYRTFYTMIFGYFTETLNKHSHVHKSCAFQTLGFFSFFIWGKNVLQP